MSRQNKVNKGSYVQAGRLTPDDMGRERMRNQSEGQQKSSPSQTRATRGGRANARGAARDSSRPRSAPEE